jgi:hypothetical protein
MSDFTRIDSCRKCSKLLGVLTTCLICDQPTQFKCSNCHHFVDDPIHTNCVIMDDGL